VFETKAAGIRQEAQKGSFSSGFLPYPREQELAARTEEAG